MKFRPIAIGLCCEPVKKSFSDPSDQSRVYEINNRSVDQTPANSPTKNDWTQVIISQDMVTHGRPIKRTNLTLKEGLLEIDHENHFWSHPH